MASPSHSSWTRSLPGIAAVLSMAACYGTLAPISLFGAMGIAPATNDALWAGASVAFAVLAAVGIALGMVRHRQPWPLMVGAIGAGVIANTTYVHYDGLIERAEFALLWGAVFWDRRLRLARDRQSAAVG